MTCESPLPPALLQALLQTGHHLTHRHSAPVKDVVKTPLQAAAQLPDALAQRAQRSLHRLLQLAGLLLHLQSSSDDRLIRCIMPPFDLAIR